MDWVPGVSQTKSLIQVASGDLEGAKQTQKNFTDSCPIVSQAKSIHYFLKHNPQKAKEIQKTFMRNAGSFLNETMNSTPFVGHIKGAIQYSLGDREGGREAIDGASHVLGSMIGGTGGFLIGGPAGAFVGGVLGGNAVDFALTGVDSAIKHKFRPRGCVQTISDLRQGRSQSKAADTFDLAMGCLMDGFVGQVAGANSFAIKHLRKNARKWQHYKPNKFAENITRIESIQQPKAVTGQDKGVLGGIILHALEETRKKDSESESELSETQVSESDNGSESDEEADQIFIDSSEILFSEDPLEGYSYQAQIIIEQLIEDIRENEWIGEPINVVQMSNRELVAFDNRKLYCAREAGIEAPILIWDENERMLISLKLSFDESVNVWGEAIAFLINKSSPLPRPSIDNIPIG